MTRFRKIGTALVATAVVVGPLTSAGAVTQYADRFQPTPIVGSLSTTAWGAAAVGPRDQSNGLEDKTLANWVYWDGGIMKGSDGIYRMYASRWNQADGHNGWTYDSHAIWATSTNLYGPYTDQGLMWPNVNGGMGHNVTPLQLADGTYAVTISGTAKAAVFTSSSLDGPWTSRGNVQVASNQYSSTFDTAGNFRAILGPDGKYHAIVNGFQMAVADAITGPYTVQTPQLFSSIAGSPTQDMEDPLLWYSGGQYHVIFNCWSAKKAYHYTSPDGVTGWTLQPGVAYDADPGPVRYTDGTVNHWTKLERPSVYMEGGHAVAMTFSVVDVEKEQEQGNDQHGSKVIVVPFDGAALDGADPALPTVYGDTGYQGTSSTLGLGTYTAAQLQSKGVANDSISSIALPPGYRVTTYDDDGFAGRSLTYTASTRDLRTVGDNDQISSIAVTLDPTASFEVSNQNSNRAMDVSGASGADGASVIQWQYRASAIQQWKFTDAGGGWSQLVNRNSGLVLAVSGGSTSDGAQLVQTASTGATSQQWKVTSQSDGRITLTNRGSGKVADVSQGSTSDGANVIQWPGTGSANQRWTIVKVG